MVLGATGDNLDAPLDKRSRHCLGVLDHLLLVLDELGALGLLEADRLRRNHVHQRTTLATGEYSRIEFLGQLLVLARQNDTAARTAQGFMRSRGHHVRMGHGIGVNAGGDQTGNVGHID